MSETDPYKRGGTQKSEYLEDEVMPVPCPLCGADACDLIHHEHGALGVVRCRSCSLIYTSPRVIAPEEVYWGDYESYVAEASLIFSGAAGHHRDPNYLEELDLIEVSRPGKGRFLDVGCNMGMLLHHARERGWDPVGVEPSSSLCRIATELQGLTVHNCLLADLPESEDGGFDVVALSDVFEHITEPIDFLRTAHRFLKPDGILYVKVPNARWNILKQRAYALTARAPQATMWDAYEHVVHYTDETLPKMLDAGGFETERVTFGRPVQVPTWHRYVGQYYQYPSPWVLDWRRHLGRRLFYEIARVDTQLRQGRVGALAPNLVAIARVRE